MSQVEIAPSSQVRLYRQRASYESSAAREIFRSQPVAHVAFVHPGDGNLVGGPSKAARSETVMNLPLILVIVPDDEDDDSDELERCSVYFHT